MKKTPTGIQLTSPVPKVRKKEKIFFGDRNSKGPSVSTRTIYSGGKKRGKS